MGPCACIFVFACLHAGDIFATVFWLENWSTGQCACISVCVSACVQQTFLQRSCGWRIGPRDHVHACLLHASIHTRICMHVVPWTNSPTRITSQVCKQAHMDMHAHGPMDRLSNKNPLASMSFVTRITLLTCPSHACKHEGHVSNVILVTKDILAR